MQELKRLVRRAYLQAIIDLRDQISRDCFIDFLYVHELKWFVYQGKQKIVDEAMQLALEFEAFLKKGGQCQTMYQRCLI